MNLTNKSIQQLRQLLEKQFGEYAETFSDVEIEELGLFALGIFRQALKINTKI